MKSIHVPASVVQKLFRFAQWVGGATLPVLGGLVIATWRWFESRVDSTYVAEKIAPVKIQADRAKADAFSAVSRVPGYDAELAALWRDLVLLHAELEVHRSYSRVPDRGALIESAKRFYGNAFDTERDTRPNDPPSKSAARALRAQWRPDR